MDGRHDNNSDASRPSAPSETKLIADMEQSGLDVAAGHTCSLEEVLAELDESIERTEARLRARTA